MLTVTRLLLLALCAVVAVLAEKDYYQILGLTRDATDSQIKKAFYKLSLKYHPDKNPGDEEAHHKYLEVTEANDVLSDPEKKHVYDIHGEAGLKQQQQPGGGGGGFFDELFGGGAAAGRRKGPDFRLDLAVSLEELYSGATKTVRVNRKVVCRQCRGTGAKDGHTKTCKACGGKGVKVSLQQMAPGFTVQMQQPCEVCGGKGKIAKSTCPVCHGEKTVMEEKPLDAVIEKGMADGEQIVFERASEQSPDTVPGDIIVVLRQQPHPRFRRDGNDLFVERSISLREALLGFRTRVEQLDGRSIDVQQSGVTPPGFVKTVSGEGMPLHNAASEHGQLHVRFSVRFPSRLTKEQRARIRDLLRPPVSRGSGVGSVEYATGPSGMLGPDDPNSAVGPRAPAASTATAATTAGSSSLSEEERDPRDL